MTIGKPADEVLQIVGLSKRPPEIGDDAEEKRVAADIVEMFAKEIGRSLHIAGDRRAEDLGVVAFPAHLATTVTLARGSGTGVEVGEGELEGRVGFDGQAQRYEGSAAVDGSLCLPV
ncbi:MAG: hypothetical protein ABSE47_17695 [Acidimicrobiales bacterium]|jgi:hypothetical protein